jgi:hypothetical protein
MLRGFVSQASSKTSLIKKKNATLQQQGSDLSTS